MSYIIEIDGPEPLFVKEDSFAGQRSARQILKRAQLEKEAGPLDSFRHARAQRKALRAGLSGNYEEMETQQDLADSFKAPPKPAVNTPKPAATPAAPAVNTPKPAATPAAPAVNTPKPGLVGGIGSKLKSNMPKMTGKNLAIGTAGALAIGGGLKYLHSRRRENNEERIQQ